MNRRAVEVVDHDPEWPRRFDALRVRLSQAIAGLAIAIEHVGSTSVPGLAAKPIIDIDVIVPREDVEAAIQRLCAIGYVHQGDLGISGREAFKAPAGLPRHNLYVCIAGCTALRNHLMVRDHLRTHPETAAEYGALKGLLARKHPHDIDAYIAGKTAFLCEVLAAEGMPAEELAAIVQVNTNPTR